MRTLLVALFFCASLVAQSPSFFITDPTGWTIVGPLPSAYQFVDTPQGSANSLVLRATNPSALPIEIAIIFVANGAGSAVLSPNFTVTGAAVDKILSPGLSNFENFTLNFTPPSVGPLSGVLRVAYAVQQNGCVLGSSDPATQCPGTVADVATFQGNGTPPQLVATYSGPSGSGVLQPSSSSPQLDFGNVPTSATSFFTITLANQSSAPGAYADDLDSDSSIWHERLSVGHLWLARYDSRELIGQLYGHVCARTNRARLSQAGNRYEFLFTCGDRHSSAGNC